MTEGMDLPARLTARPEDLANAVERAVRNKQNIIYVKPLWALVMIVIRNIPERIYKRLRI